MIVSHFSGIQSLSLRIFRFIFTGNSWFMAGGNWKILTEKMLTLNIFIKVYQILRTIKMATFKFKTRIVYREHKTTLKPRTFKIKFIFFRGKLKSAGYLFTAWNYLQNAEDQMLNAMGEKN